MHVRYPPTAQVASRQGRYLAKRLSQIGEYESEVEGADDSAELVKEKLKHLEPFEHESMGMLA